MNGDYIFMSKFGEIKTIPRTANGKIGLAYANASDTFVGIEYNGGVIEYEGCSCGACLVTWLDFMEKHQGLVDV